MNERRTHPIVTLLLGVVLTLLCVGLVAVFLLYNGQGLLPPGIANINPGGGYAEVPTAVAPEEVMQDLEQLEVEEPGPASAGELATAIPWQTQLNLGDAAVMRATLENFYAEQGFDFRIAAVVSAASSSTYCMHLHRPAADPSRPLIDQVRDGSVNLVTWMGNARYCVGVSKVGELWAGVPQADLQDFTLNPEDHIVVDSVNRVTTTTQTVDVVVTARFGMLTQSVQPGNSVKITYDDPSLFAEAMTDLIQGLSGTDNYVRLNTDRADTLADNMATEELIAPFYPEGDGRDMGNLNELELLTRQVFNSSSGDPQNPWPYDHLRQQAEFAALQAGYQGLGKFEVILEWPYEEGEWYYLQGLDGPDPQRVIKLNAYEPYKDNLYPLWRSELPSR